jgi:hypothetical protein
MGYSHWTRANYPQLESLRVSRFKAPVQLSTNDEGQWVVSHDDHYRERSLLSTILNPDYDDNITMREAGYLCKTLHRHIQALEYSVNGYQQLKLLNPIGLIDHIYELLCSDVAFERSIVERIEQLARRWKRLDSRRKAEQAPIRLRKRIRGKGKKTEA